MAVKVGDTVRYLNSVGGGRVVRIVGDIAYVDEDGFETPVLTRECVVVATPSATAKAAPKSVSRIESAPVPSKDTTPAPTRLPVIETVGGDKLNIVIGFEPVDIKALSRSGFEAFIVNDSNYYLYVTLATRSTSDSEWMPRFDGLIEPNIQEFAFEFPQSELGTFERLGVQFVAFKRDKAFAAKEPAFVEFKVDPTKFAKLHCFRPNPYFDNPVIAFDVVTSDRVAADFTPDAEALGRGMMQPQKAEHKPSPRESKPSQKKAFRNDVIEVDLHADELFDTTAGLSPADILNRQIETFTEVMTANLRHPGQKIVFIHGKGEGILREALRKELTHRFKGHDVQDASFREYGFGATQVTIRPQSSNPANGKSRR